VRIGGRFQERDGKDRSSPRFKGHRPEQKQDVVEQLEATKLKLIADCLHKKLFGTAPQAEMSTAPLWISGA
jgi:hypothetical protein